MGAKARCPLYLAPGRWRTSCPGEAGAQWKSRPRRTPGERREGDGREGALPAVPGPRTVADFLPRRSGRAVEEPAQADDR